MACRVTHRRRLSPEAERQYITPEGFIYLQELTLTTASAVPEVAFCEVIVVARPTIFVRYETPFTHTRNEAPKSFRLPRVVISITTSKKRPEAIPA